VARYGGTLNIKYHPTIDSNQEKTASRRDAHEIEMASAEVDISFSIESHMIDHQFLLYDGLEGMVDDR
jgi:hypothetical protein